MMRGPSVRNRGTVYVVVLAVLSIVITVSMSSLGNARSELGSAARTEEELLARSIARSAMEVAVEMMVQDPSWRSGVSGNLLVEKAGMGASKLSIEVHDPLDGDLQNDYSDPVEITAIAAVGRSQQMYRYRLEFSPEHDMPTETVLNHHPLLYWPLHDLDGDAAYDLRGVQDAQLQGTILYDVQDPTGVYDMPALHVTNSNQFRIDHRESMEVDYGSIALWFQPASLYATSPAIQVVCSKYVHDEPDSAQFAIVCISGQVYLMLDYQGSFQYAQIGPITGDTWHHLAVSWGEDGWKTYLDGEAEATLGTRIGLGEAWTDDANESRLRFGAARGLFGRFGSTDLGHHFTGKICEAAFFAYELSEKQVEDLASAMPTPRPLRVVPSSVERLVD